MGFFSRRSFLKSGALFGTGALIFPETSIRGFNWDVENKDPSNHKTLKPKKLERGNKIAVTAPGGAIWDPKEVVRFETLLKNMGFSVVLGETLTKKYGYLAGTDEERAKELMNFFSDPSVDGIITMRGGWGCARLLDILDYDVIRENPKFFMGFSDITSLLIAFYIKSGLVTFHGLVGVNTWNEFSTDIFNRVACVGENCTLPIEGDLSKSFMQINEGVATGKLIGGNLSVISGVVGSPYFELPHDSILFLEETNEEPYVVDRLLTHLKVANVYDRVKGVIFGHCSKCLAENPNESMPTIEVIKEHFSTLKIPVSYGSPIGHIASKWTLPVGIEVEMNASNGELKLLESAVG
jgi:muramoyltetrapeptide carboxypeptidase